MRIVIFSHSLVSDWNHGNAHFLRGMASEFLERGFDVLVYEPADGWSRRNLIDAYGDVPLRDFAVEYPSLKSTLYNLDDLDLDRTLNDADIVLVHEWNEPELVARAGEHRARAGRYSLFFHDTHHRAVTAPEQMAAYHLEHYDGVLAYGNALRDLYRGRPDVKNAWTWHEAADIRKFHRTPGLPEGDLVWIGNWGDGERADELREFLIEPVARLRLKATVYGVRFPDYALNELAQVGIEYKGWLPNYRVPSVFGRHRVTVHIPRRPYAAALAGIPTIRPFEAMACEIPLICSPWCDRDSLFHPGRDFLIARDGNEMTELLNIVISEPDVGAGMAHHALETIRERHTCTHRADELLSIVADLCPAVASTGGQ